jgi:hypothetical protein
VRLQRDGRADRIVGDGDALTTPRHFIESASIASGAIAYQDNAPKRQQKRLRFGYRSTVRGHNIDLYTVDSRAIRAVPDPEILLVMLDGHLKSSIEFRYNNRGSKRGIDGMRITNYGDDGRPARMYNYSFSGFALGCNAMAKPETNVDRVLAWARDLVLPSQLRAQSLDGCIPGVGDLFGSLAFSALSYGLGNPSALEAAGTYGDIEWILCAITIVINPQLPTVTVSCPPCPLVTTWGDFYNERLQEWESVPSTGPVCPDDDSNCTVTGLPPSPYVP